MTTTNQETQAKLEAFLERQAEANASIEAAQQALDTLEALEAESTPIAEGNQDEE